MALTIWKLELGSDISLEVQEQTKNGLWDDPCKGFRIPYYTMGQSLVFGLPGILQGENQLVVFEELPLNCTSTQKKTKINIGSGTCKEVWFE